MSTLQEFERIKRTWRDDDDFAGVDAGAKNLHRYVQKHLYEVLGPDGIAYHCKNLEEVESTASKMGLSVRDLDYRASVVPKAGLKCDILVKFVPKKEIRHRANY